MSLIASALPGFDLGVDFVPERVIDRRTFVSYTWISRDRRQVRWIYGRDTILLPLQGFLPISFVDPVTWRIDIPQPPPQQAPDQAMPDIQPPPQHDQPPPQGDDHFGWPQLQAMLHALHTDQQEIRGICQGLQQSQLAIQQTQQQHTQTLSSMGDQISYLYGRYHGWDSWESRESPDQRSVGRGWGDDEDDDDDDEE